MYRQMKKTHPKKPKIPLTKWTFPWVFSMEVCQVAVPQRLLAAQFRFFTRVLRRHAPEADGVRRAEFGGGGGCPWPWRVSPMINLVKSQQPKVQEPRNIYFLNYF